MNRRCFRFGLSRVARLLFGVLLTLAFARSGYGQNPLIFDFESGDLDGWTIVEGANTKPIGSRDLEFHAGGGPYDKSGKYYLTTLESSANDNPTDDTICVIDDEGEMTPILAGGRFVLKGTEELNRPFTAGQ